jgi:hypothetical protein
MSTAVAGAWLIGRALHSNINALSEPACHRCAAPVVMLSVLRRCTIAHNTVNW